MLYLDAMLILILGLLLYAPTTLARSDTISCIRINFDFSCERPFSATLQIWLLNTLQPDFMIGDLQLWRRNDNGGRQRTKWYRCLDSTANILKFKTLEISLLVLNQTCEEPGNKFEEVGIVEHQIDSNHTYLVRWNLSMCAKPIVIEIE